MPITVALKELSRDDLKRVLTEPKNSITRQFKASFAIDDVDLSFTEDAIEEIADIAIKQKTGARGLRAIIEKMMMDFMYEVPSVRGKKKIEITKELVDQTTPIDVQSVIKTDQNLLN